MAPVPGREPAVSEPREQGCPLANSHLSQPCRGQQEKPQLLSPQGPQNIPGDCTCHQTHGQRLQERRADSAGQRHQGGRFTAGGSSWPPPACPHVPPSRPPGELGCHGGTPGPATSPSPLTKMLSRMMFQGKRLLGTKTEKRGELVTVAMSCPPGSQPPGTAPGKDPSRCPKDPPYPQSPTPWVPATSDSPGTLAAGQHHVGHQEHSAAERDSGCQPWDPFGLEGSNCGVPAVGGHPRGAQAGDPLLTMRHSRWQRSSGQKSGRGSCRMGGMSVREGGTATTVPSGAPHGGHRARLPPFLEQR